MKKTIYNLFLCLMLLPFASCESEDFGQHLKDTDIITLKLYTGTPVSRAMEDKLHEYALSHLDVFIFNNGDTDTNKTLVHYERIKTSVAPEGEVSLTGKGRNEFTENTGYWVYVIANSKEEAISVTNLADLKAKTQEDRLLHLTATSASGAPQYFLMDGIAYTDATEPSTPGTVILNDGVAANTTELNVNLSRAAAKVVVELSKGENVTFKQNNEEGYYLRNMPTVTTLLANVGNVSQNLVTTTKTVSAYSEYTADKVTVTAYVYAHSWNENTFFTDGTSLVLNIPLVYDADNDPTTTNTQHDNSYYQIELGKNHGFLRNNYYLITGKINAPGATEDIQPVTLDDLQYHAWDWTEKTLNVGGEAKPEYLKVNKDTLRIYNQSVDETLVFSSSSPITISVHGIVEENNSNVLTGSGKPYYYNKYNVKTELGDGRTGFTYWETNSTNSNQGNGVNINAASKVTGAMSGNITVNSTLPNNKTIRYFYLLIENEDGLKEKVFVEQYPVIYVTNQLGWYSYRSDFGSSYKNKGNRYVSISLSGSGNYNWNWNGGYNYSTDAETGFWYSKVETTRNQSGSNLNIDAYYWPANSQSNTATTQSADPSGNNARIYQITVTATSKDYTVGRPRMTAPDANGLSYTDPSDDNKKLVSPSFMIASRLGVVTTSGGNLRSVDDDERLIIFRNHCANYVEVVEGTDGAADIIYDDWRLPTEAELKIIMDYQGTSGQNADAIDYLLNAVYYFGAAGKVFNTKNDAGITNSNSNSTSKSVRCVRDAY